MKRPTGSAVVAEGHDDYGFDWGDHLDDSDVPVLDPSMGLAEIAEIQPSRFSSEERVMFTNAAFMADYPDMLPDITVAEFAFFVGPLRTCDEERARKHLSSIRTPLSDLKVALERYSYWPEGESIESVTVRQLIFHLKRLWAREKDDLAEL